MVAGEVVEVRVRGGCWGGGRGERGGCWRDGRGEGGACWGGGRGEVVVGGVMVGVRGGACWGDGRGEGEEWLHGRQWG